MFNSILYVFSLIISLVEVVLNSDIVIQEASLLSQFDNGLCLVIQMQSLNTIHRFKELINFWTPTMCSTPCRLFCKRKDAFLQKVYNMIWEHNSKHKYVLNWTLLKQCQTMTCYSIVSTTGIWQSGRWGRAVGIASPGHWLMQLLEEWVKFVYEKSLIWIDSATQIKNWQYSMWAEEARALS